MSAASWPPPYDVGDLVDVIVRRARVMDLWDEGEMPFVTVQFDDRVSGDQLTVLVDDPSAVSLEVAERRAPEQWPPRRGDVWRDRDGFSWFASEKLHLVEPDERAYLLLVCCDAERATDPWGTTSEPGEVLRVYGPLELLHREPPPATPATPMAVEVPIGYAAIAGVGVPYDLTDHVISVEDFHDAYAAMAARAASADEQRSAQVALPVHDRPAAEPVR